MLLTVFSLFAAFRTSIVLFLQARLIGPCQFQLLSVNVNLLVIMGENTEGMSLSWSYLTTFRAIVVTDRFKEIQAITWNFWEELI